MKYLILGGVKSGKSRYAENLARKLAVSSGTKAITFIATAQALDEEMANRIARHRSDRPVDWAVIEEPLALGATLRSLSSEAAAESVVLVDCLTLWLTNLLMLEDEDKFAELRADFLNAVSVFPGRLILVSNETNMGVTPLGKISRRYCDEAGLLHQSLAQQCDQVELIIAGLPMPLKRLEG